MKDARFYYDDVDRIGGDFAAKMLDFVDKILVNIAQIDKLDITFVDLPVRKAARKLLISN